MAQDEPNYIESAVVAESLNIDRSTLNRWIASGRIKPVMKLRGKTGAYLFDPTEVERVRASSSTSAAAS